MAKVEANIDGLNSLMRMLKKDYRVRVGILGSKAEEQHDSKSGLTNADIGAFHEFGTNKMPRRSFLAEPLTEKLSEEIPKMKKAIFKQFFVKKAPEQFFQDLASKSLDIVNGAFNSNGYGRWTPLTAATKRYKARKNLSPNTLVARGTLSGSISAKVIKK